ncbi:phosphate ABC transporter membrane protein 2, PhoT family [Methanocella conradii HZ254]|uniref:Phosphate transport system permease protein PstA n=1 Tax=Methanocella conradii (strain DSM 24694 / JCM 17849 / CGMCC 1.5162 / HZ254) TaxID=1041930 RepID=H8I665_METCZ|nr:phosphate ABC transporter permease PstA [Methanocella conradii]AFD00712.1 phosphate ABC transporter membrane protein 2, PhoT family [Methanocella conradii HZ254]
MAFKDIFHSQDRWPRKRYTANSLGIALLWACGGVTLIVLLAIIGYVLWNGLSVVSLSFLIETPSNMGRSGGIYPMILGTLYITAIAIVVSTPLSVGAAIYMAEYAGENRLTSLVRFGADSLAGIPSIMFGMFGYLFFVLYMGMGFSLLAGGLTLALMGLPIILRVSEEAIKAVPESYRLGSLALGASKWQTIYKVVLPTAFPGIVTGVMLGMGRAIGETAAVMFTAGTVAKVPWSLFSSARTMTLHIYLLTMENISIKNAYGTAAVLVIMILAITLASNLLTRRYMAKLGGKMYGR